jgi:signal peptidase I
MTVSGMDYPEQASPGGEKLPHNPEPVDVQVSMAETGAIDLLPAEEVPRKSRLGSILYEVVETVLLAIVIWLAVNFTTARYVVEGQSMEPNLHTGQFLIVSRLAYMQLGDWLAIGAPERGDIIVFDYPGNPSDDYVKRVIGLPGEVVTIEPDGTILVDNAPLEEPYLDAMGSIPYRGRSDTWVVPDGAYFVVGDNRNSSSDSRSWGMLAEEYIVGKAWISYWPPRYWGIIPHYEYTAP